MEVTDDWRRMKRFARSYKIVLQDPSPSFNLPEDEVESTAWMEVAEVKKLVADHPEQVTDGQEQVTSRFF